MFSWDFQNKTKEAYIKGDLKELESLKKQFNDSNKIYFDDDVVVEKKVNEELMKNNSAIDTANLYNILYGIHSKESTLLTSLDTYIGMLKQRIATQNQPKGKKQ